MLLIPQGLSSCPKDVATVGTRMPLIPSPLNCLSLRGILFPLRRSPVARLPSTHLVCLVRAGSHERLEMKAGVGSRWECLRRSLDRSCSETRAARRTHVRVCSGVRARPAQADAPLPCARFTADAEVRYLRGYELRCSVVSVVFVVCLCPLHLPVEKNPVSKGGVPKNQQGSFTRKRFRGHQALCSLWGSFHPLSGGG